MTDEFSIRSAYNGQFATGIAKSRKLASGERIARTAKTLAIFWGLAVLTAFIPILHFVLVPLFLLLGLIFSVSVWMETSLLESGRCTCANCGKDFDLDRSAESWPKSHRCPLCYVTLEITKSQ